MDHPNMPEDVAAAQGVMQRVMENMEQGTPPERAAAMIQDALNDAGYTDVTVSAEVDATETMHITVQKGEPDYLTREIPRASGMTVGEYLMVTFATLMFTAIMVIGVIAIAKFVLTR